ncbi:MAG: hypothetical protein KGL39_20165 [Patescibacteria group bacterium]|nr:hypothetical protein [Patescibacteria group bacterium]
MTIQPNTTFHTRLGRKVEVIAVLPQGQEVEGGHAIIGLFNDADGSRSVETWSRDGRYMDDRESSLDLNLEPV